MSVEAKAQPKVTLDTRVTEKLRARFTVLGGNTQVEIFVPVEETITCEKNLVRRTPCVAFLSASATSQDWSLVDGGVIAPAAQEVDPLFPIGTPCDGKQCSGKPEPVGAVVVYKATFAGEPDGDIRGKVTIKIFSRCSGGENHLDWTIELFVDESRVGQHFEPPHGINEPLSNYDGDNLRNGTPGEKGTDKHDWDKDKQ